MRGAKNVAPHPASVRFPAASPTKRESPGHLQEISLVAMAATNINHYYNKQLKIYIYLYVEKYSPHRQAPENSSWTQLVISL